MNDASAQIETRQSNLKQNIMIYHDSTYTHFQPIRIVSLKMNSNKRKLKRINDTSSSELLFNTSTQTKIFRDSMNIESTDTNIHIPIQSKASPQITEGNIKLISNQLILPSGKKKSVNHRRSKSTFSDPPTKTQQLLSVDKRIRAQKKELQKERDCNDFITKILKTKVKKKKRESKSHLVKLNQRMVSIFEKRAKEYSIENMRPENKLFIQTTKINNKLIRDFGIQNKGIQQDLDYSLKNSELAENSLFAKQSLMKEYTKKIIENFDNIKSNVEYYPNIDAEKPNYKRGIYDELHYKLTEEEYIKKKKEKSIKAEEKIRKKAKKYADLVLELNTKNYGRNMFNRNQPFVAEVQINYNNLSKNIELFNFQNKILENEELFESVNHRMEIKTGKNQEFISALNHYGSPLFIKNKLRRNTVKKYYGTNGLNL